MPVPTTLAQASQTNSGVRTELHATVPPHPRTSRCRRPSLSERDRQWALVSVRSSFVPSGFTADDYASSRTRDPGVASALRLLRALAGQTAGPFTFVAVVLQGLDVILSTKSG